MYPRFLLGIYVFNLSVDILGNNRFYSGKIAYCLSTFKFVNNTV